MKTIVNIFFLTMLLFLFCSCTKISVQDRIVEYIEEKCEVVSNAQECIINLKEVLGFEWDDMYILGGLAVPIEISELIGFEYLGKPIRD